MRYYSIELTPPSAAELLPGTQSGKTANARTYTSLVNGKTNTSALNVELDIQVFRYAEPAGSSFVRVWGISLQEVSQASDLNGMHCNVFGGMQKGLPLAKPQQAGLITSGFIFQAFGNWIGTEQTLDLIIQPFTGVSGAPKNVILNWKKGTKLADAIRQTLSTAFPDYTATINISDNLVLSHDETGFYESIEQFAFYVKSISKDIVGGTYQGVDIILTEKTITVDDATTDKTPAMLAFEDLIGQPTWIDPLTVQFKTVMRADLSLFDYIKFPPAVVTQSAAGNSPFLNQKLAFQGVFRIMEMRHVGNFRQADAASWNTTFNAVALNAKSTSF